jgi:hypothetical protein
MTNECTEWVILKWNLYLIVVLTRIMGSRERFSKPLDFTKEGTCRAEDPVVSSVGANPTVPARDPVHPQHFQTCRSGQSQHAVVFHFGRCFGTRQKHAVPRPVPCSCRLHGQRNPVHRRTNRGRWQKPGSYRGDGRSNCFETAKWLSLTHIRR